MLKSSMSRKGVVCGRAKNGSRLAAKVKPEATTLARAAAA
jgi:hypothetical protein